VLQRRRGEVRQTLRACKRRDSVHPTSLRVGWAREIGLRRIRGHCKGGVHHHHAMAGRAGGGGFHGVVGTVEGTRVEIRRVGLLELKRWKLLAGRCIRIAASTASSLCKRGDLPKRGLRRPCVSTLVSRSSRSNVP
jgi:hypothetical protein